MNLLRWRIATAAVLIALVTLIGTILHTTPLNASREEQVFVTLAPGITFGFLSTATPTRTPTPINLGNFVWDDIDHDGRQDAGEPGISGITVQLWNSAKTVMYASTVTNANGNYTVVAPLPGNYRVRVVLPNAMDSFSPKDQAGGDDTDDSDINPNGVNAGFTNIISIANNVISISSIDAGVMLYRTPTPTRTPTPINLGNFVWDDLDHDGRQDAGEPGLSGVSVQLWSADKTHLYDGEVTNANGNFTLIAPLPGAYRVRFILPGVMDSFSPKDQAGGDDTDDSDVNLGGAHAGYTDVINIANNVISMTNIDAGVIIYRTATPTRTPTPINLGNFVWDDLDHDGRQDAGEPGLNGITVQLWNSGMTTMIDDTVTSASGNYTLVAPLPGSYRIRVVLPYAHWSFSPKDQGGDDTNDSDINAGGANEGFTSVISIANNVISMTNIDAGVITPLVFQAVTLIPNPLTTLMLVPPPMPTPTAFINPQPLINACAGFRLTAPLDGLPNGAATFYWDPASGANLTYQIRVLDEGRNVLATFAAGGATSVIGDVSQGAVGGGFALIVQVHALQNGAVICSDEHTLLRASLGAPPVLPAPTATRVRGN